jgi:S-adenosylmethionine decarboxylase
MFPLETRSSNRNEDKGRSRWPYTEHTTVFSTAERERTVGRVKHHGIIGEEPGAKSASPSTAHPAVTQTSSGIGVEYLVDAHGCDPAGLRDLKLLREVLASVVHRLELNVLGEGLWHVFGGQAGITGMLLLSESHLTVHTYPEFGLATFNLYCCRHRAAFPWEQELMGQLRAREVVVRELPRGHAV